jgi:hypothetical protein
MLPLRKIDESPRQLRIRVETLAVIDGTDRRELLTPAASLTADRVLYHDRGEHHAIENQEYGKAKD